jgi:hypothetical protein
VHRQRLCEGRLRIGVAGWRIVREDVGVFLQKRTIVEFSVGAETRRPDLPKIRDGHPEPLRSL